MLWVALVFVATALLAYSNGANDNIKGVATLIGSGRVSFRKALLWANVTTFAGAGCAVYFFRELAAAFSGQGIVPGSLTASPQFLAVVGVAAGGTVLLATRLGLPVSTTHALVGALAGSGLAFAPEHVGSSALLSKFLLPLAVSPFLAAAGTSFLYPTLRSGRAWLGIEKTSCLCAGEQELSAAPALAFTGTPQPEQAKITLPAMSIGKQETCALEYSGQFFGIQTQSVLNLFHFLSAGAVCFARGLNDAPKIVALALSGSVLPAPVLLIAAGGLMVLGAVLQARRVAETMSCRITEMNDGQAFSANLTAAAIVIFASRIGLPVSTTHVTCGALFGIGVLSGKARWKTIGQILTAWLTTLPFAAVIALLISLLIRST